MSSVESPAGSAGVWLAARLIASLFYRVQRTGPPIPGGAVLLVANHPNALLDPRDEHLFPRTNASGTGTAGPDSPGGRRR